MNSHHANLTPKALDLLGKTDEERLVHLKAPLWLGYERARKALEMMEELVVSPRRQRPENLLILGPSNNGKSMIAKRFRLNHPSSEAAGKAVSHIPVVLIDAPNGPDLIGLFRSILEQTNGPHELRAEYEPRDAKAEREPRHQRTKRELRKSVERIFAAVGVRVLVIDDIHQAFVGPPRDVAKLLTQLRLFGNALGVSVVCLGTSPAVHVFQTEEQDRNRFPPFPMRRWRLEDAEYQRLLNSFEKVLPLQQASNLTQEDIAIPILGMSEGLIGEIALIIRQAAREAIVSGRECIDAGILKGLDYRPPSKRHDTRALGID